MTDLASSPSPAPAGKQPELVMRDRQRLERALRDLRTLMRRHGDAAQFLPHARRLRVAIQALEDEERELRDILGGNRAA